MSAKRLATGGRMERGKTLRMTFDDCTLTAHPGDTLASALLANGETLIARSFKYHRPRGIFSAGVEEPNALVQLRRGARSEPNARATTVEAYDGLEASSQNAWPSLSFDFQSLNQLMAPFFAAGFYYKTFVGPFKGTAFWMFCEKFIRRAAGMGKAGYLRDPDSYDKKNHHCDVLIIGAGPAGLSAALAAGRTGTEVLLVEQDFAPGGSLLSSEVGGESDAWLATVLSELEALPNVRKLTRATVFGAYDHEVFGILENVWNHVAAPPENQPRQRFWQVRAKQSVLAAGAIERPLVFGGNDKPGVMLASAARTYLNRYAVRAGGDVIVATNNDGGYATALDLARSGAAVRLLDARAEIPETHSTPLREAGVEILPAHGIVEARGRGRVSSAMIAPLDDQGIVSGPARKVSCDLVAVSGGWSPTLHLWSQRQQTPVFDEQKDCFVALAASLDTMKCAGSVLAAGGLSASIDQGFRAGADAARDARARGESGPTPSAPAAPLGDDWSRDLKPLGTMTGADGKICGKAFVDLQHDVTVPDIDLAHREGYVSVEHLKRYTTTGMATDQGKLSNLNALARMALLEKKSIPEVGTTIFRPPFTPVTIGALAGHDIGLHFAPIRRSAAHDWHLEHGAVMIEAGAWMRPRYYPQTNEKLREGYIREADHVRNHVGVIDVSTLGKIAVQGPDAAEFLNRIYVNGWKTLAIGRLRYGIMLGEDGFIIDDGATARLGEHDYFMSTTTANAASVLAFAERLLQTAWRDLEVHVTTTTDQWAAFAVAGPKSRALLSSLAPDADLSATAMPNNAFVEAVIADVPVRIHRMSFSGELAYEVYVASGFGDHVWRAIIAGGEPFDLKPYGTEAMGTLRIEKGHVSGPELDGRTVLADLRLEGFASSKKPFVGSVLMNRPVLWDPARQTLIGLEIEGDQGALPGSLLFGPDGPTEGHGEGWVSSTTYSPALGRNIALGLLARGPERLGESVRIVNFVGGTTLKAKVVSHHFFDSEGVRQNG